MQNIEKTIMQRGIAILLPTKMKRRLDGVGFTIDKQKATELFYQQNVKDSLKHSGMGMYISRLYCEKHGGQLLIENEKQSGAVITAVFHRIA